MACNDAVTAVAKVVFEGGIDPGEVNQPLQWLSMALLIQRLVVVAEKAPNVTENHRCNGAF